MKKTFCDACGAEVKQGVYSTTLVLACHIAERKEDPGFHKGHVIMVDGHMVPVSGRDVNFDLCAICYNHVASAAMDKIDEIRREGK